MKLFKEFKEFAVKGNMIDIAIGVIIGAAFNKVVDVIVKDIIMPPLTLMTGAIDYTEMRFVLKPAHILDGEIVTKEISLNYGKLVDVFIDFFIIALTVFLVVKVMNRLRNKAQDTEDKTVATPKEIELLSEMKQLLQKQNDLLESNKS